MRTRALSSCCVALALLVALSGCATREQVEDIVDDSNQLLLDQAAIRDGAEILADTDVTDLANPSGKPSATPAAGDATMAEWQAQLRARRESVIAKVDQFIAQHGDNPNLTATIDALRLRKALVLLASGQGNLAKATFASITESNTGNVRDLLLYRTYETQVWWWDVAGKSLNPSVVAKSPGHIQNLSNALGEEQATGTGIYYYLGTMRAHMRLKLARSEKDWRPKLGDGLEEYCVLFDPPTQAQVAIWVGGEPSKLRDLPTDKLRWIGHAEITYKEYDKSYVEFLESIEEADPAHLTPDLRILFDALRSGAQKLESSWPQECAWLAKLFQPAP